MLILICLLLSAPERPFVLGRLTSTYLQGRRPSWTRTNTSSRPSRTSHCGPIPTRGPTTEIASKRTALSTPHTTCVSTRLSTRKPIAALTITAAKPRKARARCKVSCLSVRACRRVIKHENPTHTLSDYPLSSPTPCFLHRFAGNRNAYNPRSTGTGNLCRRSVLHSATRGRYTTRNAILPNVRETLLFIFGRGRNSRLTRVARRAIFIRARHTPRSSNFGNHFLCAHFDCLLYYESFLLYVNIRPCTRGSLTRRHR